MMAESSSRPYSRLGGSKANFFLSPGLGPHESGWRRHDRGAGSGGALPVGSDPSWPVHSRYQTDYGKCSFVLLPHRWVVARTFAWPACFRRPVRDCGRLARTPVGLHVVAFAMLLAQQG
jgi:hypothetical protein